MSSLDQLKHTFFDECDEALQQIETGLTDIGEGGHTDETINAVFRGVHSVKGGAGIFGFEALVEFAHVFETVLDGLRRGSMTATPEMVDVLLSAADVLSDLVQMSRSNADIPAGFGSECRNALESIIEGDAGAGGNDDSPAPADFDGFDFTPVPVSFDDSPADSGIREFAITFRPKPEMLKKGNEPRYLFQELRKLGDLVLAAQTDLVPSLASIEAAHPYVWWTGTLKTSADRAQIDEVFEFVIDDCDLEINEVFELGAGNDSDVQAVEAFAQANPAEAGSLSPTLAPAADEPVPAPPPSSESVEPANPLSGIADASNAGRPAPVKSAATTTRIELERIDRVVNMVGELVIAQAMLGQTVQDLPEATSSRLAQILEEVVHHTRELKDSVMSMRAQPVGSVFQRMPRLVREVSAKTRKKVRLETVGENTEVDRSIIERLSDPLTHIIRNSIDHGIESPADRLAAGKSEEGIVRLSAAHRGGRIVIEIADDGAGINTERVLKKARESGLVSQDAALSEEEIGNLIMLPGFSTAEKLSDISGRGVGMDVVRSNIQEIGGRISLKSVRGRGMTIQLSLPLTLAVMDGMVIKVGDQTYVMPLAAIVECLRPARNEICNLVGTRGMLQLRGEFVPVVQLGELLDIRSKNESGERVVIITDAGEGTHFGLVVDELCGHQQVVIKSIEDSYGVVPGLAAATILGNGRVAFILDVEKLSDLAADSQPGIGKAAA
jgi:two-component system, chemotaxis family, sensor kinase CheA